MHEEALLALLGTFWKKQIRTHKVTILCQSHENQYKIKELITDPSVVKTLLSQLSN